DHQPTRPPTGGDTVDVQQPVVLSPYLNSAEAAAYLRTTVQGIYSLVKRGRVAPMPGSGKLLFTRESLDRYLTGKFRRRPSRPPGDERPATDYNKRPE
ncbi:MAG: helix-turn-helix domain-containing protein, partial [Gemmataceae bacterium]|nr:helix-turn-helix domain-containing protein [Gemmataceae bacterium]